jgi:glycosyltransferase involved in cell wall biosynthesis
MKPKLVTILFLGDIKYDSRSLKMINTLVNHDYRINIFSFHQFIISPELMAETAKKDPYLINDKISIQYIRLRQNKKVPFLSFYMKALLYAFKNRTDFFICPDIYSLPITFLSSLFTKSQYIYDSRELFASLASLQNKKFKQSIWKLVEKAFAPHAKNIITVNESIAKILENSLGVKKPVVISNFPTLKLNKEKIGLPEAILPSDNSKKLLIYQGGLQIGRGIPILLDLISSLEECNLLFLGNGKMKEDIKRHPLYNKRVFLIDNVSASNILRYTTNGYLGMSLFENFGKNYYLVLPNKMFEYCHAGVPVIASDFPEVHRFVNDYKLGELVNPENKQEVINKIRFLINNSDIYNTYKQNCLNASATLNWEAQEPKFLQIFN